MKVVVSGYYGFDNCGDDAVLGCLITGLKERGISDITVFSNNPTETAKSYGVNAVSRNSFKKIFRVIKGSDAILSGGGSLFQDKTSSKSLWYYLAIVFIGVLLGKKVFIVGQGIGPIDKKFNRWLTSKILNKVNKITVRDEASKEYLKDLNIRKEIIVAADPVINLKPVEDSQVKKILEKENIDSNDKYMIICTREWGNSELSRVEIAKTADRIAQDYGFKVVFLPFYYKKDEAESEKVSEYMKLPSYIIRGKYKPEEVMGIIKNSSLLIGVRFHSLVFAFATSTPFVGISYDPKIDGFLNSINMEVFKIEKFTSDDIVKYVNMIFCKKEDYINNIKKYADELKQRSEYNFEIFDEYIKHEVQKK
jgi:polysaccharide pyruvyl transferase CsaB